MTDVRFLGIRFRSNDHKQWFLIQLFVLLSSSLLYSFGNMLSIVILLVQVSIQIIVTGAAIYAIRIKRFQTQVYSDDCIWFNPLLSVVHVTIFSLFYFRSG